MLQSVYTPVELSAQLAGGFAVVLPWIGAGVGGGVALMFIFMGIRKGFGFFSSIAENRSSNSADLAKLADPEFINRFGFAESVGMNSEEAWDYASGTPFNNLETTGNWFGGR